jgi:hypothetical protein
MLGVAGSVTNSCDITHKLVSNQGSALFDGTNDFIDASSVASDISLTAGSISLWARTTATSSNESFFSVSDGNSGANKIVIMYDTSNEVFKANYKTSNSSQQAQHSVSNSDVVSNGWFHIVMTYDTTANEVKLYYNGSLVTTRSSSLTAIDGSSVTFDTVILGKSSNADNTYHQGYIDEYAYFARVLSATEIARIYGEFGKFNYAEDLDLTGAANALKQWLRFGDGSAGSLSDITTGIVDMSNPTLGNEIIANNDFSKNEAENQTNLDGGIQFDDWIEGPSSGSATFTSITNGYRRTAVTPTDEVWQQRIYQNISSSLDIGSVYRFTFTIVSSIDANFTVRIQELGSTNVQTPRTATTVLTANTPVTIDEYFACTDNTNQYVDIWPSNKLMTEGQYYELSNLSLKKVQGNPGFTSGALINQNNLPG